MPRGGYDCTGAAPGSFASRQGRQMYPCGGGTTPRASQSAVFPGVQYHQPAAAAPGGQASQVYAAAGPHATMSYGHPGPAPQAGFVSQQPQGGYMTGGFGPAQQQPRMQQQTFMQHGYAPGSTMQVPGGGGVASQGMVYAGGYPQQQQHHASVYGAGFAPVGQAPYYRQQ
ncbi:hypothetical protein LEL_01930 [Akanthomyces lecanii RCEF 1005]|uniref:Uncharacterized protein n=1 Tax=Akanthomyces lecanii RCEF 1005 TaxID=1081108 RepID=A0A168KWX4_CORDF|nr:hypothetical protein LEL_01930 [Akanthomyces lecanii RCEF 1005]